MKKQLLLCFLLGTLGAQAQEKFTIEGKLENIADGTVFNLFKLDGNVGSSVAVDTLQNGTFQFELATEGNGLEQYSLMARDRENFPPMSLDLWVRPGSHLKIEGNNPYIYTWKVESDTEEQQLRQKMVEASREKWEELQRLHIEVMQLFNNNPSEQDKAKADSLSKITQQLETEVLKNNISILRQTPVNNVWMNELYRLGMAVNYDKAFPYRKEVEELYNLLTDEQKKSNEAKSVYLALNPPKVVQIGDMAADATMYDLQGNTHYLKELRGKYILLDFWSSGCGPCIMAQPELKEISELYQDSLAVVSLSIDTRKRWEAASKSHPITWNNWNDLGESSGLYARYGVRGIPHFVLISPEGKMIDTWTGYGKELLKLRVKSNIVPKPAMTITEKNGHKVINHPDIKSGKGETIRIDQIELTDSATILHIHASYIPHYWIQLDKGTSLTSNLGVKCPVLHSEGFPLGEQVYMPESGEMDFTLYFAPLPKDTRWFDFSEGEQVRNGFKIEGVKLVKE